MKCESGQRNEECHCPADAADEYMTAKVIVSLLAVVIAAIVVASSREMLGI